MDSLPPQENDYGFHTVFINPGPAKRQVETLLRHNRSAPSPMASAVPRFVNAMVAQSLNDLLCDGRRAAGRAPGNVFGIAWLVYPVSCLLRKEAPK